MDVKVGPHWYRNSNGVVEIEGLPQIELDLQKLGSAPVRIKFAIFDNVGKLQAKVEANSLVMNEQGRYRIERVERGVLLRSIGDQKQVLAVNVVNNDQIEITAGEFYTLKGHVLTITPQEWSIETTRVGPGETDMKGQAVIMGA